MQRADAITSLAPVGWAALIGAFVVLVWSVPGIVVNPDFAVGDAASAAVRG